MLNKLIGLAWCLGLCGGFGAVMAHGDPTVGTTAKHQNAVAATAEAAVPIAVFAGQTTSKPKVTPEVAESKIGADKAEGAEQDHNGATPASRTGDKPPREFVPTQKIKPAQEVIFPTDI